MESVRCAAGRLRPPTDPPSSVPGQPAAAARSRVASSTSCGGESRQPPPSRSRCRPPSRGRSPPPGALRETRSAAGKRS
eukprot:5781110-Prymnesium_polylepis.1